MLSNVYFQIERHFLYFYVTFNRSILTDSTFAEFRKPIVMVTLDKSGIHNLWKHFEVFGDLFVKEIIFI